MDVHASLRNLRMSPRKVRLVINVIRGAMATEADTRLQFIQKDAALPVRKLLRSAMANAQHNFQLQTDQLRIKAITADQGPTLKRFRPRAMGRSAPIRKRTTHVAIVLTDGRPDASAPQSTAAPEAPKAKAPAPAPRRRTVKTSKSSSTTN